MSEAVDAEILTGTGQRLREIRFLRAYYALTSFHATGDGELSVLHSGGNAGAGASIWAMSITIPGC